MNNREEVKHDIESIEETEVVETVENMDEEVLVSEEDIKGSGEVLIEEQSKEVEGTKKKNGFGSKLLVSLLDQVFCAGTSIILLFVISAIIQMFGYRFVLIGKYNMGIILYIIVNILYAPIMTSSKLKNTFGNTLLKL